MTQVSGTNERFLRKDFVVPKLFEIMSPNLFWLDVINKTQTDSRSITYKREATSDADDTNKKRPKARTASAKWTYVNISDITVESALLQKNGFAIKIDEDAIDYTEGIDEIQRGFRKLAYWLAEDLSTRIGTDLKAGATTPTWTPAAVWSDATNRKPVEDLRQWKHAMRKPGYAYRLTDTYVHMDNLEELEAYLLALDVNQDIRAKAYGYPTITQDQIDIPIVGRVHGVENGLNEGEILGMDRNNPGATMWYNNSPRYSQEKISYRVINPDGTQGTKTINNFGFNFNKFTDPDTHEVVMQVWWDTKTVVNEPYAVIFDSGI